MPEVIVQELRVYPLKSAQGIDRSSARLTPMGLQWDRYWMVVRRDGTFLTQRTHPRLAQVATALTDEGLALDAEGLRPLLLPWTASGPPLRVRIWKDVCEGLDQGDAAAEWISAVLDEPVRVVRVPETPRRTASPDYAGPAPPPLAFADAFPLLVCNRASLDTLNTRLPGTLPMDRFRPNLVLEGLPAFAEDRISGLEIGPIRLTLVKPCTRCVIPSHDQRTGGADIDPLPALRKFRFDPRLRGVTFGENAIITAGAGSILERGAACRVDYDS